MENRAAVFTSEPQAVEVYQAGAWWSGELLGWRHSEDGTCQVRVRVVLGGVEETAWTDLSTLRLPECHLAIAPEPASAGSTARNLSVARHPSSRRGHRAPADAPATAGLPVVRDLSSFVSDAAAAPSGGRRRAPETSDAPATVSTGGRRRAPEEPPGEASGGRRRAPETSDAPATVSTGGRRCAPEAADAPAHGRRRAPEEAVLTPAAGRRRAPEHTTSTTWGPTGVPGRHGPPARATAERGRHRTADTGSLPAVSDATGTFTGLRRSTGPATPGRGRAVPPARPSAPSRAGEAVRGAAEGGRSAPAGSESELLTRPMRLSDHAPRSRRPRLDGSLRGG